MDIILQIWASVLNVLSILVIPLRIFASGAILILVGWVIAKALQWLISYVLRAIMLDKACQVIGITPILTRGEIKKSPSDILADLAYWVVAVLTLFATADFLGLKQSLDALNLILRYLVSLSLAAFTLALAVILSTVVSSIVVLIANNIGVASARTIARVIKYSLVIFGFLIAIQTLGIPIQYIMKESSLVVGFVALGAAIAFGLGCKDVAGDFIAGIFKQR